jgi:hypothetical protein
LLDLLFAGVTVTRFDAAQIDDHLDAGCAPSVILMNPPFSAMAHVDRRMADTTLRHINSALARLCDGGRLVAITGASFSPDNPAWTDAVVRLQGRGRVVFSAAIDGAVYAKHGTVTETRLLVIDKRPAPDPKLSVFAGMAPDVATLLGWVTTLVPPRLPIVGSFVAPAVKRLTPPRTVRSVTAHPSSVRASLDPKAVELAYETVDVASADGIDITDALYETYQLQSIRITGALPHPSRAYQRRPNDQVREG